MAEPRKTNITTEINDITHIKGYALPDLIENASFAETIFLILKGKLPSQQELSIFNAILVAAIDHGPLAPSADIARRTASTGNTINTAVGNGIAAIGDWHGGAIEQCGQLLQDNYDKGKSIEDSAHNLVTQGLAKFKRLPGFGHKVYTEDPRVASLFGSFRKNDLDDTYLKLSEEAEKILEQKKGKKICLNIDGGMAAILCSLGFDWPSMRGIFIIARTPGLVAQSLEQMNREPPVMRGQEKFEYDGPTDRKYPSK